jgi:polyhydroxyalkanoate synthesis regulator phasin
MMDYVKRALSFGLGAALLTGDALRQLADDAVSRGEMSRDEAKNFIDDITKRADQEKDNMQNWMREQMAKMIREVGVAEASRLEALERRVDALQFRLDAAESEVYDHEEAT